MATFTKRVSKATGKASYKVQVRRKGAVPLTKTFSRKTDAQRWANDREAEINQNTHFGYATAQNNNLHDVIERYIKEILPHKAPETARGQTGQLGWWQQKLGGLSLSEITPDHIVKVRNGLTSGDSPSEKPTTGSTANRYTAALSNVFTVAIKEWSLTQFNPVNNIKNLPEPEGRTRYLDDHERVALLKACEASNSFYLYPIVIMALSTGCRLNEVIGMRWENVIFDNDIILIPNTKNKNTHTVSITKVTRPMLETLYSNRPKGCAWIFPNQAMNGPISIRSAFETAVKIAAIEDFTFHDLRHTTGSYLAMNGATAIEIAAALNHKTLQMVKRYAHLSKPHAASVLNSMNDKYLGDENKNEQ